MKRCLIIAQNEPRNLKFIPYSFWETVNWIGKHLIMDFYYPFMFLIFFLFVTPVVTTNITVVSSPWFYFFLILFVLFISLFIYRKVQRKMHNIENIGILNEDGWREFEFKNLNPKKEVKNTIYTIGFIGDIMKMDKYNLKFEKRIQKFFDGVDLIVGNLEGIILTNETKNGGIATQNHNIKILEQLEQIVPKSKQEHKRSKWLLSVSNNHSADFGVKGFKISRDIINNNPNFYAFGDLDLDKKHSSFPWDPTQNMDGINIVTGTMWTNKKSQNLITRFKSYNKHYKTGKFNIFFPHWHYENECYIRSKIQRKTISLILKGEYKERNWIKIYKLMEYFSPIKKILKLPLVQRILKFLYKKPKEPEEGEKQKWDLIFGHHSHVPQPIKDYGSGILGYSGGNFTSSKRRKKHISGLIMKCEICKVNNSNQLKLGKVHWCYTRNERKKKQKEVYVIVDCLRTRKKYFENRNIKFKTNLIIFSVALGIWLGIFWLLGTINYLYWIVYSILIIALLVYFGLNYSRFTSKI